MSSENQNSVRKHRAVVFDDSGLAAKIAAMRLSGVGMDVRVATTLEELKTVIAEFKPEVLLSDLNVPDAPADDLCAFLRRETSIGNAAIWIMSGMDEAELEVRAKSLGADGSLSKDRDAEEMAERFRHLLEKLTDRTSD